MKNTLSAETGEQCSVICTCRFGGTICHKSLVEEIIKILMTPKFSFTRILDSKKLNNANFLGF